MEWILGAKASQTGVTPGELKVCELCGTLNHRNNRECFTCGWHGQFGHDVATIDLACRRLAHQHEGVLLEHVTSRNMPIVSEFGRRKPSSPWLRFQNRCRNWCEAAFSLRSRRTAQRPRPEARQPATPQGDN